MSKRCWIISLLLFASCGSQTLTTPTEVEEKDVTPIASPQPISTPIANSQPAFELEILPRTRYYFGHVFVHNNLDSPARVCVEWWRKGKLSSTNCQPINPHEYAIVWPDCFFGFQYEIKTSVGINKSVDYGWLTLPVKVEKWGAEGLCTRNEVFP